MIGQAGPVFTPPSILMIDAITTWGVVIWIIPS